MAVLFLRSPVPGPEDHSPGQSCRGRVLGAAHRGMAACGEWAVREEEEVRQRIRWNRQSFARWGWAEWGLPDEESGLALLEQRQCFERETCCCRCR